MQSAWCRSAWCSTTEVSTAEPWLSPALPWPSCCVCTVGTSPQQSPGCSHSPAGLFSVLPLSLPPSLFTPSFLLPLPTTKAPAPGPPFPLPPGAAAPDVRGGLNPSAQSHCPWGRVTVTLSPGQGHSSPGAPPGPFFPQLHPVPGSSCHFPPPQPHPLSLPSPNGSHCLPFVPVPPHPCPLVPVPTVPCQQQRAGLGQ